jgi:hypothetical protein
MRSRKPMRLANQAMFAALLTVSAAPLSATPIFYFSTQANGSNGNSASNCPSAGSPFPCGTALGTVDASTGIVSGLTNLTFQTGSGTNIGNEELFDIAVTAAGEIYGISNTSLYRVNPLTNIATLIAATTLSGSMGMSPVGGLNGLAFLGSTLYATAGGNSNLYTINTSNGEATVLGSSGFNSGGDIAFMGGRLFLATASNQVVELNPANGAVLNTGPTGLGNSTQALKGAASDGTNLYLAVDFFAGSGDIRIVQVNTTPGAGFGTITANAPFVGLAAFGPPGGMTEFVAVPEPSTYLISALGLGLIGWASRKRK